MFTHMSVRLQSHLDDMRRHASFHPGPGMFLAILLCLAGDPEHSASQPLPVPVCGTDSAHRLIGSLEPSMLGHGTPRETQAGADQAFRIVINPGPGLSAVPAAVEAFERAAAQWARRITDPITVTIDADLRAYEGQGWLGAASARLLVLGYDAMRTVLIRDAGPRDAIVAALPTTDGALFRPAEVDPTKILATKANFKAVGFRNLDEGYGASDGTIAFNTMMGPFDFDARDGVAPNAVDFESVAAHEIGHLLGFISSVDDFDYGEVRAWPMPLDLFRFASDGPDDPSTLDQFTSFARALTPGIPGHIDTVAETWSMSTGRAKGDGRQASHWKDAGLSRVLIGAMDPTLARGARIPVTGTDERALDLIGWDIATPASACADDGGCDDGNPHTTERCVAGACATLATAECVDDDECLPDTPCVASACIQGGELDGVPFRACRQSACLPATRNRLRRCFGAAFRDAVDLVPCLGRREARQFAHALEDIGRLVAKARNRAFSAPCLEPFSAMTCEHYGAYGRRAQRRLARASMGMRKLAKKASSRAASGACSEQIGAALEVRAAMIAQARTDACGPP